MYIDITVAQKAAGDCSSDDGSHCILLHSSFLVAPLISYKENKNHFLVNISHCFLHPGPKDREESRAGREAEAERACKRKYPWKKIVPWFSLNWLTLAQEKRGCGPVTLRCGIQFFGEDCVALYKQSITCW